MNDDDEAALDDLDEDENTDKRHTQRRADKYIQKNGELSDSEDEEMDMDGDRPAPSRDRRIMQNYRHIMDAGENDSGVETGSGMATPLQASSLPDEAADEMNVDDDDLEGIGQPTPSPQNGEHVNGSATLSGPQSPLHDIPAMDDGDIEMEDAAAPNGHLLAATAAQHELPHPLEAETITVQQQQTPPDSPPTPADEGSPIAPNAPTSETTARRTEHETASAVPASSIPPATTTPEATGATAEEVAIKKEVFGDDEGAQAAEEGRMERAMANAEGEAKTEAVAKVEAAEGDDEATTIVKPPSNHDGGEEAAAGNGAAPGKS